MEGKCSGCQRVYDISDDFLAMGGKAKCPHCMLELEFPSTTVDRAGVSEKTEAGEDKGPVEIDSHCPSCKRRFKVDRDYLEMGNQAKCPHCAVDLEFDRPSVDHDKLLADLADELAKRDDDEEVELDELEAATRGLDELTGDTQELEDLPLERGEEAVEEDSLDFEDEVDEEANDDLDASAPTTAAIPSLQEREEDEADEDAGEVEDDFSAKTDLLPDTRPDYRLPEDDEEEEPEDDLDSVLVDSLGEGEAADEADEPDDSEERPTEALFGSGEKVQEEGSADGLFSGLASTQDWASAAAKWAETGFKSEEMPSFIQEQPGEGEAEEEEEEEEEELEEEAEEEEVLSPRDHISAVEVSDADIMMMEQIEEEAEEDEFIEEPTSPERRPARAPAGKREPTEPVIRGPRKKEALEAIDRVIPPEKTFFSRLRSPVVMIPAVIVLVLLVGGLILVFSGNGEDPETAEFSTKGIRVAVVEAPAPSEYSAKSEALEHYGQGNQYAYRGRFEDAILEYQRALRIDPVYPHPHRALGAVYAALGKAELSKGEYEMYLKLAPKSADAQQVQTIIDSYDGK